MLSFHKCPSVPFVLSVNYSSLTLFITLGSVCMYVQVLSTKVFTLYSPFSLLQSVLLSYLDFDFSFLFFLVCCTLLLAISFFFC